MTVDNNLRSKMQAHSESKQAHSSSLKKDTTSLANRDLNDVFCNAFAKKLVKKEDFQNSKYLTTLLAIVPASNLNDWNSKYEELNEWIVPRSSKVLDVPAQETGQYKLCRFVCFRKNVEDIKQKAKTDLKLFVREYEFDETVLVERQERKGKTLSQTQTDEDALKTTCVQSFKEIYGTYIHLKVLKVVIDSHMRFGSSKDYLVYMISVYKGKEKKVHTSLINQFAEASRKNMYGTKEELGDTEDFFPYAFSHIGFPAD